MHNFNKDRLIKITNVYSHYDVIYYFDKFIEEYKDFLYPYDKDETPYSLGNSNHGNPLTMKLYRSNEYKNYYVIFENA